MADGWIGVDLDGTLAHYDVWHGPEHIGKPIPQMVERVKQWIAEGQEVRIFTARVSNPVQAAVARPVIEDWCMEQFGQKLAITNAKDYDMIELWDDRAIEVAKNTGRQVAYRSDGMPWDACAAMFQRDINELVAVKQAARALLKAKPSIQTEEWLNLYGFFAEEFQAEEEAKRS